MLTGYKIKKIRELRNFTQEFVASQMGITQESYSKIEANKTNLSVDRLEKLAEIFSIDVHDLLKFDDQYIFNHSFQNQKESNNFFGANDNGKEGTKLYDLIVLQLQSENKMLKEEIEFLRTLIQKP